MGMWRILEDERRGMGMRDELDEAYEAGFEEGCKQGYRKAMEEVRGDMGFRDGGGYEMGERYPSRTGIRTTYGERRMRDSRGRYM